MRGKPLSVLMAMALGASTEQAMAWQFSSEPFADKDEQKLIFAPLVQYLQGQLGEEVTLRETENFPAYVAKIEDDDPVISLDSPHIVNARVDSLGSKVVARLSGHYQFVVVVKTDEDEIGGLDDLIAKPVCERPAPQFISMVFHSAFPGPLRQPIVKKVDTDGQALSCLAQGKGRAALLDASFWKNTRQDGLKVIYTSSAKTLPSAITVPDSMSAEQQSKVKQALLSCNADEQCAQTLHALGAERFVASSNEEYKPYADMLDSVFLY